MFLPVPVARVVGRRLAAAAITAGLPRLLVAALLVAAALGPTPARAQTAVPYYSAGDFVTGVYTAFEPPRVGAFVGAGDGLEAALASLCRSDASAAAAALGDARTAWGRTMTAWEGLTVVAIGPIVSRRSLRNLDFQPIRPKSIERAIASAPATDEALELIGAPAKGFPALEWLLWTQPVEPGTQGCAYAARLGRGIALEAAALRSGFDALAARDWRAEDEQAAAAEAMGDIVGQWVGGVERLRWARIGRPLREAESRGTGARGSEARGGEARGSEARTPTPAFLRMASGLDREGWLASWASLRALAVGPEGAPVAPGAGLVSIEAFLRGRGALDIADRLGLAVTEVDRSLAAVKPADPATIGPVVAALDRLKRIVEADAAPALQIRIGFSDADGD